MKETVCHINCEMEDNAKELPVFQEGLTYSDDVINAVRYGYQYRLEAERRIPKNYYFNYCLPEPSGIVLWLANLIINGTVWDVFKAVIKSIDDSAKQEKNEVVLQDTTLVDALHDPRRFYEYITEFKEHKMDISDKERDYIYEEIIADYTGKAAGKIYETNNRFPTPEEFRVINKEAREAADIILYLNRGKNIGE